MVKSLMRGVLWIAFSFIILLSLLVLVVFYTLKDSPIERVIVQGDKSYQISAQHLSLSFGKKRPVSINIEKVAVNNNNNALDSKDSQQSPVVSSLFNILTMIAECHIRHVTFPHIQLDDLFVVSGEQTGHIALQADLALTIESAAPSSPIKVPLTAYYNNDYWDLTASGLIKLKAKIYPSGSFEIKEFNIFKKHLIDLNAQNLIGSFENQTLGRLSGDLQLSILGSDLVRLSCHYQRPSLQILSREKLVAQASMSDEKITAKGLLPLYSLDVSFAGQEYTLKKINWEHFNYNPKTQQGLIRFNDIQVGGLIPMSVESASCEGALLQGTGVCEIGKVSGPQGIILNHAQIVVSGFSDLMGTFKGNFYPSLILPFKDSITKNIPFFGQISAKKNNQSIVINVEKEIAEQLVSIDTISYDKNDQQAGQWTFEGQIANQAIKCSSTSSDAYLCGFKTQMTTYDSELINVATTAQAQKIALTLPESWSALSDISQIVIDMQCPALWRIEAFDAARSTVGQTQLFFDDGFQQLTSVDAEIWDRHMQGVLGFDEQKIQINAYYLNLDAALGLYRWYRHTALKNLIPLSNQRPALKNVTIDFRKVSLGQQDLGKIHLSYALSEQEHESRWTLQHHAIRAQMLEKQEDNHLFSREAVVYADNISQLSPVIPELSGIQKGQVILNYYQNATSPDKHSLYLAANDVFLKQATCRQLKILNVLSGYAFSKEQFEALLSDGWFIDKMGIDALWQNDVLFIKKANVHSGAASFDAYGHYNRRDDLLAIDLKISPKISSALPSLGFIGGPLGSALAFAGVQIFGAQEFDRLNQQKWQLYGSIKAPQIRPWEAEVIDLTAGYDQDNAAIMSHSSEVVVTRLNHVREEMQNNAGPAH